MKYISVLPHAISETLALFHWFRIVKIRDYISARTYKFWSISFPPSNAYEVGNRTFVAVTKLLCFSLSNETSSYTVLDVYYEDQHSITQRGHYVNEFMQ